MGGRSYEGALRGQMVLLNSHTTRGGDAAVPGPGPGDPPGPDSLLTLRRRGENAVYFSSICDLLNSVPS